MTAPIIQARYEELAQVADRFGRSAEVQNQLIRTVQQHADVLIGGSWQGRGVTAFAHEMDNTVMPAMGRLADALAEAQRVTLQVSMIVQAAEEAAARPFQGDQGAGFTTDAFGPSDNIADSGDSPANVTSGISPDPADSETSSATPGAKAGIWQQFEFKGDGQVFQFDVAQEPGSRSRFDAGLNLKYGVDGAAFGEPTEDGFAAIGGEAGVMFGMGENGFTAGPYGEYYTVRGKLDGVMLGDTDFGWTGGVSGKLLSADGFIGLRNNSFGASIGGSLVSAQGETGLNVAGVNVGIKGEVGLKLELGFKIGQETELKLPFVTLGFGFGKAIK